MNSGGPPDWKPRIYRCWYRMSGRFAWTCTEPKANAWTGNTLSRARTLQRQAMTFCHQLNYPGTTK